MQKRKAGSLAIALLVVLIGIVVPVLWVWIGYEKPAPIKKAILASQASTQEMTRDRIGRLMFKVRKIEYIDQTSLVVLLPILLRSIRLDGGVDWYTVRTRIIPSLESVCLSLELHQLADAICNTDGDMPYVLTALAWQESHFLNRRGKHGEVSHFQILPSTVTLYSTDRSFLYQLESDPVIAVAFVTHLLKDWGKTWQAALKQYNTHRGYPKEVIRKFNYVKAWVTK